MSGDELDRLIEIAPDMEQPPVEETVGQSPAAWSQGGGSEPFRRAVPGSGPPAATVDGPAAHGHA